jgi:type IV pilus assembly protein PilC
MMSAMFMWIIPMFSDVYVQLGANLPAATRKLVSLSEWISINFSTVVASLSGVVAGLWLVSKTRRGGYIIDSIKLKTPIFGSLLNQSILNKFSKTAGILLNAGVPVIESMNLIAKIVSNRVYEVAIGDATEYIRDGFNITSALRRTEIFPPILLQLSATGEETGELDTLLDKAADYYYKQVNALVERMTTLIEPILILMVGVIIGVMVIITYLPVFYLGAALQSGL